MFEPLAGAIGAVVAAIAAMLVEWLRSDSRLRSHSQVVEELARCTTFLEGWSRAYALVEALPEGAGKKLAAAYAETILVHAGNKLTAAAEARTLSDAAGRTGSGVLAVFDFLRIRAPTVGIAWIPLALYFASVGIAIRIAWMKASITAAGFLVAAAAAILFWLVCWAIERWLGPRQKPNP